MKEEKTIDLKKVRSIYEIAGSWVWQYGKYQEQYIWDRSKEQPVLVNKYNGVEIKGLNNIKKYCRDYDLILEHY